MFSRTPQSLLLEETQVDGERNDPNSAMVIQERDVPCVRLFVHNRRALGMVQSVLVLFCSQFSNISLWCITTYLEFRRWLSVHEKKAPLRVVWLFWWFRSSELIIVQSMCSLILILCRQEWESHYVVFFLYSPCVHDSHHVEIQFLSRFLKDN